MTDDTYMKWRLELADHQEAIDNLEDAYFDKICDEAFASKSDLAKAQIEYKIERRRLVRKLEAHYMREPQR